jgi:Protein of unknown function (DUF3306)
MSEGENFLARWSSRKLASRTPAAASEDSAQQEPRDDADSVENAAAVAPAKDAARPPDQAFDPAQLPPLDSIGADTDITAFLRPDVPPELTRAALRRAWTSDPAIKNFVGLVENGWDFNDPTAMPGFGPISPEEVARLAGSVIAAMPGPTPATEVTTPPAGEKNSELTNSRVPSSGSLAAAPNEQSPNAPPNESPCDSGDLAAQQNEPGKQS